MTNTTEVTAAAPERRFLTPDQLADVLQVSAKTLKSWRYHGTGPKWTNVGRNVRYRWAEVDKWLKARTNGGTE